MANALERLISLPLEYAPPFYQSGASARPAHAGLGSVSRQSCTGLALSRRLSASIAFIPRRASRPQTRSTHHNEKTRGPRAFFADSPCGGTYAACLCIAPDADTVPRIAFTERSIAAHSRLISAAARPSEKYSRAPSP